MTTTKILVKIDLQHTEAKIFCKNICFSKIYKNWLFYNSIIRFIPIERENTEKDTTT